MIKVFFLLLLSFDLHASIKLTLNSELAIGSEIELKVKDKNQKLAGIFLGRMSDHPTLGDEILLFNKSAKEVQMIDVGNASASFSKDNLQAVVSPYDQAGETCAAYALFHYWYQTAEFGFSGNGILAEAFKTERSRMKFLEEAITRYYMGRSANLHLVMKKFGDRLGFKCREKVFNEVPKAADYLFQRALTGKPIIMEFFIGPKMAQFPYRLMDFETGFEFDPRLWIPRRIGERNSGGHAIVAIGAFEFEGKKMLVVLDSNWTEPRLWDLDEYFSSKTAIDEMIFHSCD